MFIFKKVHYGNLHDLKSSAGFLILDNYNLLEKDQVEVDVVDPTTGFNLGTVILTADYFMKEVQMVRFSIATTEPRHSS